MPDTPMSLRHPETPQPDDAALAQAARAHVANARTLQLIAELLQRLRDSRFSWWTPQVLRDTWDATERMRWFEERPDIRQRITCRLTGLRPKAARGKELEFQATLIDSVMDHGDVGVVEFENAFDPIEVAAYAPAAAIWQRFREQMPWDQDTAPHHELVAWLFDRLLASHSAIEGMTREPILTPYAIRTTIPGKIWHSKLPLDVRVAIDEMRFEHEQAKPGEPIHLVHDLSVATPTIIADNIPLRDLLCVFDVAERAMGLPPTRELAAPAPRPKVAPVKAEPPWVAAFAKAPEVEEAEPQEAEVKPAPASVEKVAEETTEVARAEMPKADARTSPAAPAGDKTPEKPAEKARDRFSDRWERVANKVLEKVGKEGGSEDPWNTNR